MSLTSHECHTLRPTRMLNKLPGVHQVVSGSGLLRRRCVESCGALCVWPALAWQHNASLHPGCHVEPTALLASGAEVAAYTASTVVAVHLYGGVQDLVRHCRRSFKSVRLNCLSVELQTHPKFNGTRSALIFEFGWLPLVMLGGRTGSACSLILGCAVAMLVSCAVYQDCRGSCGSCGIFISSWRRYFAGRLPINCQKNSRFLSLPTLLTVSLVAGSGLQAILVSGFLGFPAGLAVIVAWSGTGGCVCVCNT